MSLLSHSKRIIRRQEVERMCGISRSSIYEKINPKSPYHDPTFPAPISLGAAAIGWVEHEVQGWINQRIQDRQNQEDCA